MNCNFFQQQKIPIGPKETKLLSPHVTISDHERIILHLAVCNINFDLMFCQDVKIDHVSLFFSYSVVDQNFILVHL